MTILMVLFSLATISSAYSYQFSSIVSSINPGTSSIEQQFSKRILVKPSRAQRLTSGVQGNSSFELCDYWLAFGIRRQECIADDSDPTTTEVPIPICNYKFLLATCTRYDMCESKKLCVDMSRQTCCHPPEGTCPTPVQMGYKCNVVSPINWCSSDNECAGKKCCSTGCGYNICV